MSSLSASARRVLSIGSAVMDTFIRSEHFQVTQVGAQTVLSQNFGDKVEIDHLELRSGGGASNTAVALQKMGFQASVVAELGKDNLAQLVIQELEAAHLDLTFLIQERKEQTGGSVILLGPDGQRIAMVHRGAASMLGHEDIPWQKLPDFEWFHISSLGQSSALLTELAQYLTREHLSWSWNPGKQELAALNAGELVLDDTHPEILFLNDQEWESVTDQQAELRAHIPLIVVTKGKAGGVVYEQDMPIQAFTAAPVQSLDDTGAGDAFAAAFVAARLREEKVMTAARWGVLNAASVVQKIGSKPGLLTYEQLICHQQWYD